MVEKHLIDAKIAKKVKLSSNTTLKYGFLESDLLEEVCSTEPYIANYFDILLNLFYF